MKKLKEKKAIRISLIIFKTFLVIFALAFIVTVYLQRLSDNKLSVFNFRMFTVVSESMEPKYKIGDVLFAKDIPASQIKVGDALSYKGTKGSVRDKIITHEVVSIEKEFDKYSFHTKGLSNLIEDPIVYENQIYGVVVYKSVVLSAFYKIIATNIGFFLCIIIPLLIIVAYEIIATLLDREEKKRSKIGI